MQKTAQRYYSDRKEFNRSMHKLISQEQLSWIHDDGSVAVLANGKLYLPCNYWSLLIAADLCVLKSIQKICHKWLQPVLASFRLWSSLWKGLTRFIGSISILCLQTSKLTINCFSDVGFRALGFPHTLENFLRYISCVADLLIRQKLFIWLELWLPAEYKRVGMFAEIGSSRQQSGNLRSWSRYSSLQHPKRPRAPRGHSSVKEFFHTHCWCSSFLGRGFGAF